MSLLPIILFYSLEEPVTHVFARLLALLTARMGREQDGWSVREILSYLKDPKSRSSWPDPKRLDRAVDQLRMIQDRLIVIHRPSWTVEQIVAHARSVADGYCIRAVVVDYLQRVASSPTKFDRRDIEISHAGRMLKSLAVDLDAPVIATAQINREAIPKGYRDKLAKEDWDNAKSVIRTARPDLHHLREGGAEQEADLVLGLLNLVADFRHEGKDKAVDPNSPTELDVGVLKHRRGRPGRWVTVALHGRTGVVRDGAWGELD